LMPVAFHTRSFCLPLSATFCLLPSLFSARSHLPSSTLLSAPALWDIAFARDPDTGANVVLNLHRNQLTARTIATGQVLWADTTALRHVLGCGPSWPPKQESEYFAIRIRFLTTHSHQIIAIIFQSRPHFDHAQQQKIGSSASDSLTLLQELFCKSPVSTRHFFTLSHLHASTSRPLALSASTKTCTLRSVCWSTRPPAQFTCSARPRALATRMPRVHADDG
jgi:hypothetical protein